MTMGMTKYYCVRLAGGDHRYIDGVALHISPEGILEFFNDKNEVTYSINKGEWESVGLLQR